MKTDSASISRLSIVDRAVLAAGAALLGGLHLYDRPDLDGGLKPLQAEIREMGNKLNDVSVRLAVMAEQNKGNDRRDSTLADFEARIRVLEKVEDRNDK